MASFRVKICWGSPRKRKKISFRRVPSQLVIENSKKIAKKFKKLKNTTMASLQAKIGWERQRKREEKKIVPTSS